MLGKFIAAIVAKWQIALGFLILLISSHGLAYCKGRNDGAENIRAAISKAQIQQQRKTRDADENADAARQTDDERNDANAQERDDAIASDGRTGLSCQRLRQHYSESELPKSCERKVNPVDRAGR